MRKPDLPCYPARLPQTRVGLWPLSLMVCALALGSHRLGAESLWVDEAASAGFALGGPSSWLADHNMALYYMLLSAWMRVFGSSEVALRAPSVLCFVVSVPLLYALAQRCFGELSARIAGALHVGNAFLLQLAQEARGYMLALMLVLCAQLALVQLLERPRLRLAAIYGVSLGLASYAHVFAFWTWVAHVCVLAPRLVRPVPYRRACLAALLLAAAIAAPLFIQLAAIPTDQVSWIRPLSAERALALPVVSSGGSLLLAAAFCGLFVWFARDTSLYTQLVVASLLVPVLVALLLSAAITPLFVPKYFICSVPALQLGASVTLARMHPRWTPMLGAVLALASLRAIAHVYTPQQKERWREATALLAERLQPGEPLLLDLPCPEPLDYYVLQQGLNERWAAPRWPVREWAFPTPDERPVTRAAVLGQLAREAPPRIWQISNRSAEAPGLGELAAHYRATFEERWVARGDSADPLFGPEGALVITVRAFSRL
jgi:mannosyltransferase